MAFKFVLEGKGVGGALVELDVVVSSNRQRLPVCREGMIGDWVMEQLVNLGGSHVLSRQSLR
jgi:hypothetical protein